MNYEKMTKAELISKLKAFESGTESVGSRATGAILQETEEKYRQLIETAFDAIFIANASTGIILFANERAEELIGIPVEEMVGMHHTQVYLPEDVERNKKLFKKYAQMSQGITSEDIFVQHNDGRKIPVEISYSVFELGGKNVMQSILRDITERKKSEKMLAESEKRYRAIIENAPVMIDSYDSKGRCLLWNLELEKTLGWSKSEAEASKDILKYIFPDHKELARVKERIRKSEGSFQECVAYTKDGDARTQMWADFLLGNGITISVGYDITERKQIENALQGSEERYRAVFEQAIDSVAIIDADTGKIIEFNKHTHENLGYTREEFKKLKIADIDAVESSEDVKRHIEKIKKEGVDIFETKHRTKYGDIRDVLISVKVLSIPGRNLFSSVWRDITERKQMEEELRESSELTKRIIENSVDCIKLLDLQGNLLFMSKGGQETLEINDIEPLLGKSWINFWKGSDHEAAFNAILKAKNGSTGSFQGYCPTFKDKPKWWDVIITPIRDITGKVERLLSVSRDITERKQMEEVLLQSEKMKAMGVMTSGIAHEFNNVLAIVSGNVQLLKEKYRDDKGLIKVLRTVCRVADDGANIVDRMYDFTNMRLDSSRFVQVNISDLVKQSIDFTMPRWKNMSRAKGISYYIDVEDLKKIPAILGNPSELREVFVNIINNALDAMPAGGRLSFSTWREDGNVCASISDTGKGMSEDVKKRIFDPFFTTRSPEGTGLGLSVTYGIITRHCGKIDVKTRKGKGSTFTMRLPTANEADHPDVSSKPSTEEKVKNLKILVVDDDEDMCEILSDFFIKEGHKVKSVNNGADGISLLKSEYFDLVLCDLAMPNFTGMDIIKVLYTLDKRPKVGLITGWKYKMEDLKKEGLKADLVVKKPFKFSELRRDISNVLEANSRTS